MKVILSHSGKQHSYHVAKALNDLGFLEKFYTSSYISSKFLQNYILKHKNTFWTRRFLEGLNGNRIESNWHFEGKEIILRKLFGKTNIVQEAVYKRDMAFDRSISKKLLNQNFELFWGFQGSCFRSLKIANEMGKISFCELSTAHVAAARTLLGEESRLHPEWADSFDNLVFPKEYEKQLEQEPHMAKYVIAASEFTRQSLIEDNIDPQKIIYLPLGFDSSKIDFLPEYETNRSRRPLKLLYVGTITQRKGIKYLLEAMKCFKPSDVELHMMGNIQGSGSALAAYKGSFVYHQALSQSELFMHYKNYDVLVLPTIFEGFGLVIVEAMAAGLPVVTTSHSIGAEIIEDGKNGYIVPIRDINSIVNSINLFLNMNSDNFYKMSINARKSIEKYSWDNYTINLNNILNSISSHL